MILQSQTASEFRNRYLVDQGPLLRPGGRRELLAEMARLRDGGQTARILLLPRGEDLAPHRRLWDDLRLDYSADLLLLFNGDRWEARGWGLEPTTIAGILDRAEPDLRVYYARGLSVALRDLGEASPTRPGTDGPRWLSVTVGAVLMAALAVAAIVGLAIRRRMRLARERRESFHALLNTTRSAFADVMLQCEDLSLYKPSEAQPIQLKAVGFEKELISIEQDVEANPRQINSDVTRGKVEHLQDELRVLASTILQKRS